MKHHLNSLAKNVTCPPMSRKLSAENIGALVKANRLAWLGLCVCLLMAPLSSHAAIVAWRAAGQVSSIIGDASLLPLPAAVGDAFIIDFEFDPSATDTVAAPSIGSYPLTKMIVTMGSNSLTFADTGVGAGAVAIQTDPAPNLWGVHACLPTCSTVVDLDEARMNLFFPAGFIASDALTPPPSPSGADVQFGLFSRGDVSSSEAFVVASLSSLAPVPLPAAVWLFGSGLLGVIGIARRRSR